MRATCLILAVAMTVLSGCASTPPLQSSPTLEVTDADDLPAPTQLTRDNGYVIGTFDKLVIDVMGFSSLTDRELLVDGAGTISIPIAGSVQAAGKTPRELQREIVARLKDGFVRDPVVAVNLTEASSQFVTVSGEVVEPGNYPALPRMTLMRAVASAKGASEFAKLDDVVVFRTVEGQRMAALYNLSAIRRGNYPDPTIYAQDVVVVGESASRRLFDRFIRASTLITTPIVALISSNAI